MIDFPFLYRATLFTYTIKPETENIQRIQHLFADKGLLPSMFQENINGIPFMRFEMIVPNGDLRIRFMEQRIDIIKSVDFSDFNKISTERNFCSFALECFQRIMNNFTYKAFRVAFSGVYILKELDIQKVCNKFINQCELFSKEKLTEWNFRNVFKLNKNINGEDQLLNYCIEATSGLVESTQPNLFKSRRVILTTDLNTFQEDTIDYKFSQESIKDFFDKIAFWNEEVKESYCKLLN